MKAGEPNRVLKISLRILCAAVVLAGRPVVLSRERGKVIELADGHRGMVTVHPSSILRMPDQAARHAAFAALVKDLKAAVKQAAAA